MSFNRPAIGIIVIIVIMAIIPHEFCQDSSSPMSFNRPAIGIIVIILSS
jgi:hypothetical protein